MDGVFLVRVSVYPIIRVANWDAACVLAEHIMCNNINIGAILLAWSIHIA